MVKLNKIYTRTGDDGTSGLVDGSRIAKSNVLMHAIGDVDEANCAIGLALQALDKDVFGTFIKTLQTIQNDMFDLGADIATPKGNSGFTPSQMELRITTERSIWLENIIDEVNISLKPLNSFILPGGSAAALHMARAITRRAERSMVMAHVERELNPNALVYINRLSDLLFILCRAVNNNGEDDILWLPGGSR